MALTSMVRVVLGWGVRTRLMKTKQGSAIPLDEIKRFEVTEVYAHPNAKVDIVFVHGLNGDPRHTWTGKNGTFWPTQLLPVSLKASQARILTYGYNGDVYTFGSSKSPRFVYSPPGQRELTAVVRT